MRVVPGGDRGRAPGSRRALRVWRAGDRAAGEDDRRGARVDVPAVYVQLWVVRIVPARVSVPDGLLMTTLGRLPAAVVGRAGERLGAGAVDEQGGRAAVEGRGLADRALGGDACR